MARGEARRRRGMGLGRGLGALLVGMYLLYLGVNLSHMWRWKGDRNGVAGFPRGLTDGPPELRH